MRFSRISSVALTRVVPDPGAYVAGVTMPSEVVLTIGWNVLSHVELEPAHCGDENCEADHGYMGTITADDLTLRVSEAADGADGIRQVLAFAAALSRRHGGPSHDLRRSKGFARICHRNGSRPRTSGAFPGECA